MLDSFSCPVCGQTAWIPVETFVYLKPDGSNPAALPLEPAWGRLKRIARLLVLARPRRRPVTSRALTPYQFLRRRVLFEVWFPGQERVTLTASSCGSCGVVAYSPRPSDKDVAAKYAFLKQHEPDIGGQAGYPASALRSDRARADRVYERCIGHLGPRTLRVLDYGGGNGKLLEPWLATGHACYLVDYNENPLPGMTKIADDLDSFTGDDTFDLIICSHVLEHVSDLSRLVSFLQRHLHPEGLLYAEVPQEIWAGLPLLDADPVTHINFFTADSLAALLRVNGLRLTDLRQEIADYGGAPLEVMWALARVDPAAAAGARGGTPPEAQTHTERLLHPSRRSSLRKMWRLSAAPRFRAARATLRLRALAKARGAHPATLPPSTGSIAPVTKSEAAEAR